ncbi:HRDC domain-containing protein [Nocardioides limicola]|uniref:HRDC domain-containing protein n=1 Tax=Nocardioides limicola TaxID=2803368 RepID=UPI00193C44BC|nr:HRDC domain-containing protein [Nocardioides sp. DJM-14]
MTEAESAPPPPEVPLLELRDPLPEVTDSADALARVSERLAAASGPVAIDAERASGYRYSGRAYLVQLRREGAGTALVDPIAVDTLAPLAEAIGDTEWILHAATQDLPCLAEVGLRPASLFDTELAGRLLGYPRVGLAAEVEALLGKRLRKEHSAADWSTRPLPESWLQYAALDVEVLVELRALLVEELEETGKSEWARQEFEHLLSFEPTVRVEPWRRTSGTHKVRGRRMLAAVRTLWEARDRIAAERDITPSKVIPDSAIIAAASAMPTSRRALLGVQGFVGRGAARHAADWLEAIEIARTLPEEELPSRSGAGNGPPPPRAWADKDPVAARRLAHAKESVTALSDEVNTPAENLLTPDTLRRVLWRPPVPRDESTLAGAIADQLREHRAREWQIELMAPLLTTAVLIAEDD